ncbi:hypothetical protein HDU92_003643 [Lobulomyces angularis]|nr:hypothetical protein HDU92_003643 [Lobulomyces angularis]
MNTVHVNLSQNTTAGKFSLQQAELLYKVATGLNVLSILSCIAILISFVLALFFVKDLTRRVTFKLTGVIAVTELLFSSVQIYEKFTREPNFACEFGVFLYAFFSLFSSLLSFCIGVNLHIVFVYEKIKGNSILKYLLSSISLAFIMSFPPLFLNVYTFYGDNFKLCWFSTSENNGLNIIQWYAFYVPLMLISVGGAILTAQVWIELNYKKKAISTAIYFYEHEGTATERAILEFRKNKKVLKKLGTRLLFYPLVPFLSQFFNIVSMLVEISTEIPYFLFILAFIFSSLQGFFTATLFFTLDPSFLKLKDELMKLIKLRRYESNAQFRLSQGVTSHNSISMQEFIRQNFGSEESRREAEAENQLVTCL